MKRRLLRATALLAVAAIGLSACNTKVGQAAIVGGDRISDSDLSKYVSRSGPTQQAQQQSQPVLPKVETLTVLIQQALFRTALAQTAGGVPSQTQLTALHDEASQRLLGATAGGDAFDTQLVARVKPLGFTEAFVPLIVNATELEDAFINRSKVTTLAGLVAALRAQHISVSVAGRYGEWKPAQLRVDSTAGVGLPSFVTFEPGATGDAAQ